MIKINLLRARKEKKKAGGTKDLFTYIVIPVICLFALMAFRYWRMSTEKEQTMARIQKTREEIKRYEAENAKAQEAKKEKQRLDEMLAAITTLKKQKSIAARVMDEVSIQKPEKLQLEIMKKEGAKLGIEGVALDDETVANFMTSLRRSKLFKNVDLVVSEQIEQSKVKLKKFTLACEISPM